MGRGRVSERRAGAARQAPRRRVGKLVHQKGNEGKKLSYPSGVKAGGDGNVRLWEECVKVKGTDHW